MFKKSKDFQISSSSILSKQDVKVIKRFVLQHYQGITEADLNELLPRKARIECTKLKSRIQLYGIHGEAPLFFDIPDKECIIPTIFMLWKFPTLLPKIYTYGAVSEKLISGADLMLPGIIIPKEGLFELKSGSYCSICVSGNPLPFAVGIMLVDKRYIELYGMKGRGVSIIHSYEDMLWEYGGKIYPNDGYQSHCVVAIEKVDDEEEGENDDEEVKEKEGEKEDKEKEKEEIEKELTEMDNKIENIPPIPTNENNIENDSLSNILNMEMDKEEEKEEKEEENNINDLFSSIDNEKEKDDSNDDDDDDEVQMMYMDDIDDDDEDNNNNEIDIISEDKTKEKSKKEMDLKLLNCLLQCFHTKIKDEDLPIHAGILYQSLMIPCRQKGDIIDIKESSYKKMLIFLKEMKKLNLLEYKIRRGIAYLSSINRENDLYKSFEVWKNESGITIIKKEKSESEMDEEKRKSMLNKVDIRIMYKAKKNYYNEIFELSKGLDSLYSVKELRDAINNFVKENNYIYEMDKKYVNIPLSFFDCIGKDKMKYLKSKCEIKMNESDKILISRDKLNLLIIDKCVEYVLIKEYGSDRYVIKKGEMKKIEISEEKRVGRKYITQIKNIEEYGINLNLFVSELNKLCASSVSINMNENVSKNKLIQVQGRFSKEINEILLKEYKIPSKYVIMK